MTVWAVVEPVTIDFNLELPAPRLCRQSSDKPSKLQSNSGITRAALEAQIRALVGEEKRPIEAVASQLGVGETTVRRMCRTLQLGPYRGKDPNLVRSKSSQVPFGWSIHGGVLTKDRQEWPWVLKAAEMRREGQSLHKIAAHFAEHRVRTKNGGRWFAKTISQILEFNAPHIKREKANLRRSKWASKN